MHELLKVHVQNKDIANEIIGYAQTGHRWYQFNTKIKRELADNDDFDYFQWFNEQGVVFNLEYDDDDYFRGNDFYKEAKDSQTAHPVCFNEWRNELDDGNMKSMTDEDLAVFVIMVEGAWLIEEMDDHVDWLIEKHA